MAGGHVITAVATHAVATMWQGVLLLLLLLHLALGELTPTQSSQCDEEAYAKAHYERCCGNGRFLDRRDLCFRVAPVQDEDERTPSYPKLRSSVSAPCTACSRLVDNFKMGLLPRLSERQAQLRKHHSRSRLAATATVGELEAIVEEEVERICSWPRTHHNNRVRKSCDSLVEERSEDIVVAISSWAREGSYGLHLSGELSEELRPALCQSELRVCSEAELDELLELDADEAEKLKQANETGHVAERPLESEVPSTATNGTLLRVVGQDFVRRVVEDGSEVDFLIYMFFPGRTVEVDDTHARLRAKYIRLAEFLDAPGSNGSLVVGWMDCVFNVIPHPHGAHVHADTIALYPARHKSRPNYWNDLKEGDVELHQLIDFVHGASANEATRAHVERRAQELGERGLHEALSTGLMGFEESLGVDERKLQPLNLTRMKDEL